MAGEVLLLFWLMIVAYNLVKWTYAGCYTYCLLDKSNMGSTSAVLGINKVVCGKLPAKGFGNLNVKEESLPAHENTYFAGV